MLILITIKGPDKGKILELPDRQPVVLGRGNDDLALSDSKISRRHSEVWRDKGYWYITDYESSNGTYVNREKISQSTRLHNGDRVQIGRSLFIVAIVDTRISDTIVRDVTDPSGSSSDSIDESLTTTMRGAVETDNARTEQLLEDLLDRLKSEPLPDGADEGAAEQMAHSVLLEQILDRLATQESAQRELAEDIKAAQVGEPAQLQTLLDRVSEKLDADDARNEQLLEQIGALAERSPADDSASMDELSKQLADKLDEQGRTQRDLFDELRGAIEARSEQGDDAAPQTVDLSPIIERLDAQQQSHADMVEQMRAALAEQLEQAHAAQPNVQSLLEQILVQVQHRAQSEQLLAESLRSTVTSDGEDNPSLAAGLENLAGEVAAQARHYDALLDQLRTVADNVSQQAEGADNTAVLERLDALAAAMHEQRDMLAAGKRDGDDTENTEPTSTASLAPILASLEAQDARHQQVIEVVREAIASESHLTRPLIDKLSEQLAEHGESSRQVVEAVREAIDADASRTEPLLQDLAAAVGRVLTPDQQRELIAGSVGEALAEGTARIDERLDTIAGQLDLEGGAAQRIVEALREALDADASRTEPLLQEIAAELSLQPGRYETLVASLRELLVGENAKTHSMLQSVSDRLDKVGPVDEKLDKLTDGQAAAQELLQRIADRLDHDDADQQSVLAEAQSLVASGDPEAEEVLIKLALAVEQLGDRNEALLAAVRETAEASHSDDTDAASRLEEIAAQITERLAADAQGHSKVIETLGELAEQEVERNDKHFADLTAKLDNLEKRHDTLVDALRDAVAANGAEMKPLLDRIADRLDGEDERDAKLLDAVRETAASRADETRSLVEQLVETLEGDRHQELASVIHDAIAAHGVRPDPMIEEIAQRLDADAGKRDDLINSIKHAIEADSDQVEPLLKEIASHIEAQQSQQDKLVHRMREAIDADAARTQPLLEEILQRVEAIDVYATDDGPIAFSAHQASHPPAWVKPLKIAAAVALLASLAGGVYVMGSGSETALSVRSRIASLFSDPQLVDMQRELAETRQQNRELTTVVGNLQKSVVEGNKAIAKMERERLAREAVDAVALSDQTASIRKAIADDNVRMTTLIDSLSAQLAAQQQRHDQVVAAMKQSVTNNPERLEALLANVATHFDTQAKRQEELIKSLDRAVAAAQKVESSVGMDPQALAAAAPSRELIERVQKQLEEDAASREQFLASLTDTLKADRAKAQPMVEKVIAQLEADNDQSTQVATALREAFASEPAMQELLAEMRYQRDEMAQALAMMDVARTMRLPYNDHLLQGVMAVDAGTTDASAEDAPSRDYLVSGASGTALGQFSGPDRNVVQADPAPLLKVDDGLTSMQRAFKLAFESKQVVVYGGKVNPFTGKLEGGKVIDPSMLRTLKFIDTWEKWYQFDAYTEADGTRQRSRTNDGDSLPVDMGSAASSEPANPLSTPESDRLRALLNTDD